MFEIGQTVLVISDKGVSYDGSVMARATGDNGGPPAYQVAPQGHEHQAQWHKACDVFLLEEAEKKDPDSIENFLRR